MFKFQSKTEKASWLLVLYCWAAYTSIYIGRKNFSVCLSDMIADGVIDNVTGGTVGTSFLLCYAIGQFANGLIGDRFHPRHMIGIGLFLAGAMNICMGLNHSAILFIVIWGVCGFASSMLWSPIIRAISTWTKDKISYTAASGLAATIPIGTILCYFVCSLGLRFFNWRIAFFMCGFILIFMATLLSVCFHRIRFHMTTDIADNKEEAAADPAAVGHAKVGIFCAGLVFCAVGILFNGILKDGLDLWIPTVLSEKFIPSSSVVSLVCTILPIFNIFGVYIARFLFYRFRMDELSVCGVMFAVSTVTLLLVTVLIRIVPARVADAGFGAGDIALAVFVTLLFAVSSTCMLGANAMLLTFIPLHFGKIGRASTVTGMLNCFSYAAAAVSGVAIGSVSESYGWEVVFIIFIASAALGGIVSFAGHKQMKKKTDELDRYIA